MTAIATAETLQKLAHPIERLPTWRWVHVAVAALAMVATMPGRTQGLGLITEPVLHDLGLTHVFFGQLNFWATLLGAFFCLPVGWLLDRLGSRVSAVAVLAALGVTVMAMSRVGGDGVLELPLVGPLPAFDLFVFVLLTRALGQSALSVVSITLINTAAGRRSGPAMGLYAFLVAAGFMVAFGFVKFALESWHAGWREVWNGIGLGVLVCAVVAALLIRPAVSGWTRELSSGKTESADGSHTLSEALRTPAFWVFALATTFYGMLAAGVLLFNESVLRERHFDREMYLTVMVFSPMVGLAANLACGWLATRWALGRLLAISMLILATALLSFPFVTEDWHVYTYASAMGVGGGMVTVLFFAVWGRAFGPTHLGKIQGAAQMLTVFGSAVGPWLLAASQEAEGSYVPLFQIAAGIAVAFAAAAWFTPLPKPRLSPLLRDA